MKKLYKKLQLKYKQPKRRCMVGRCHQPKEQFRYQDRKKYKNLADKFIKLVNFSLTNTNSNRFATLDSNSNQIRN